MYFSDKRTELVIFIQFRQLHYATLKIQIKNKIFKTQVSIDVAEQEKFIISFSLKKIISRIYSALRAN